MKANILLAISCLTLPSCGKSVEADAARFAQWTQQGSNQADTAVLQNFLAREGVGGVVPIRQLLRSDTEWRRCGAEPFDVPPQRYWPNMVPTLKLIRDEVQPLTGPVEALSVFRGAQINTCIGGASGSQHLRFYVIDMRPTNGTTRDKLIEKLCALYTRKGEALNMGLGIYKGTRFHIDTAGYRRWGQDHRAASSPCNAVKPPTTPARPAARR